MAGTAYSTHNRRRVDSKAEYRVNTYEDGNAVRKLAEYPEETDRRNRRPSPRRVSRQVQRNREKAKSMSAGYVLFLSLVCVVTLCLCIQFLQLRSKLTTQSETIAVMQSDLSKLKADNDAYYKQAQTSISMDDIRNTALNELGMHYASESQIRYYDISNESYVRQYQDVADDE